MRGFRTFQYMGCAEVLRCWVKPQALFQPTRDLRKVGTTPVLWVPGKQVRRHMLARLTQIEIRYTKNNNACVIRWSAMVDSAA